MGEFIVIVLIVLAPLVPLLIGLGVHDEPPRSGSKETLE